MPSRLTWRHWESCKTTYVGFLIFVPIVRVLVVAYRRFGCQNRETYQWESACRSSVLGFPERPRSTSKPVCSWCVSRDSRRTSTIAISPSKCSGRQAALLTTHGSIYFCGTAGSCPCRTARIRTRRGRYAPHSTMRWIHSPIGHLCCLERRRESRQDVGWSACPNRSLKSRRDFYRGVSSSSNSLCSIA